MSRQDRSLEDFDVIKLLLFFLLFVVVSMGMILGLIVPDVREYKQSKSALATEQVTTKRVYEILLKREDELVSLRTDNRKILEAFSNTFNEKNLIQHARNFFEAASLEKKDESSFEEDFIVYELTVTSYLKTPTQFYNFLESLSRFEAIIRTDFPIEMWVEDGKINAVFNIKVYQLKS